MTIIQGFPDYSNGGYSKGFTPSEKKLVSEMLDGIEIFGAGGGGASDSKSKTPVEQPNTLQSVVKGRILDLIAYGPIYGLVDGLKSVYLDDTPVMNADGSYNFQGITIDTREGYPNQSYMPGFPAVENSIEIGTEILFDSPPVRSVTNNDADAVLVTVQFSSLVQQKDNGDSGPASVTILVDVRSGGGAWNNAISDVVTGKTTSPYPRTYRVELKSSGPGPYDIRVRRGNKESTQGKIQDKVSWTIINEVIDSRMSHPNMAMVGITIDSKLFGATMPSRSYDMKLSIISVPSNYDPDTRQYTGIWDGTFKQAWSDNPAWCYYDLATHPVIGGGLENVDKWYLYRIGQYCDQLVPDGYGNFEPRFTCNTIFSAQEDAITALNTFASCFRGMAYWGTNTLVPVADMPASIKKIVAPANVENGDFEYVGTSIRERHSVCVVMWNDPDDAGKSVPEVYEDPRSIEMYGWVETRVTAVACNSRGQARRLAKWILYSERMETQTLTYTAVSDHADLRPGDLIEVADPYYQGPRMAGRVVTPGLRQLVLDQVPDAGTLALSGAWYISVLMPDGSISRAQVSTFGAGNVVNLLTGLNAMPEPGFMWALSSTALELPQFRVVAVSEDDSKYKVTATEYDPRKYDIVELDLVLPDRPTSVLPTGQIAPPLDLSFEAYKYQAGGSEHQGLVISWTPPKDVRVDSYVLDVMDPSSMSFRTVYNGPGTSFDLKDAIGGQWGIRVRSISFGIPSQWVSRTVQIAMLLLPVPPDSIKTQVGTFSITLYPQSAYPAQLWEFWRSLGPLSQDQIEDNATQLPTGTYLVDAGLRANRLYYYWVRGVNQYGKSTWYAVQEQTLNDFDDIINAVKDEIENGELFQIINDKIELIAGNTATEVVDAALAGIQEQIDNLEDALAYDPDKAYVEQDVVRQGSHLYQAKGPVPAAPDGSNAPPNPLLWEDIGEILATATGIVLTVNQLTQDVTELDGKVTAAATSLEVMQAQTRSEDGLNELRDTLNAYSSNARFSRQIKVISEANLATVQLVESLESTVGENKAEVTELKETVADLDSATATKIETINSTVAANRAEVVTLTQTVATNQQTTATQLTQVRAEFTSADTNVFNLVNANIAASVTTEQTARANADNSLAQAIQTTQASVGSNTASIQTTQTAVANINGRLSASLAFKLQLTADGRTYAAGMGLDITTQGGITQSQILFQANRIAMINVDSGNVSLPFLMESGTVYINNAMFKNASIDFLKITDTLQSDNFVSGVQGWRLAKSGYLEINGPGGTGRMLITNRSLRVFDGSNVKRVQLGDLTE